MSFEVVLTHRASRDLDRATQWWADNRSPKQAARWFDGFIEAILSLECNPLRCPAAREADRFPVDLREMLYGLGSNPTHRAIFIVRENGVIVLTIQHLAQADLDPSEFG